MTDVHFLKWKTELSFKIWSVKVSNPTTSKSLYRWWCIALALCRFRDLSGQGFQVTFVLDSLRSEHDGNRAWAMAVAQFLWCVATNKMVSLCVFKRFGGHCQWNSGAFAGTKKLHSQGPTSSVADPKLSQRHVNDWAPTSPSTLLSKCHQNLNLWGDGRHRASAAIVERPKGVNCGGPTIFDIATSYIKLVFEQKCSTFLRVISQTYFGPHRRRKGWKQLQIISNSRLRSQDNKSETRVRCAIFHDVLVTAPQKLPHIMPQLWPWRMLSTLAGSSPYGAWAVEDP